MPSTGRRPPKLPRRRPSKPGPGQQVLPGLGTPVPVVKHSPVTRRSLRALSAAPIAEPLPNMLPFDSSRVAEAGYSSDSKTLYVRFVDGTPWVYYHVEPNEWRNFRRSSSPGRFINRVLNSHSYNRANF